MKVLYGILFMVPGAIAKEWLKWMLEEHIPEIRSKNNEFIIGSCRFWEEDIVSLWEEEKGNYRSFILTFYAEDLKSVDRYTKGTGKDLFGKYQAKYGTTTKIKTFSAKEIFL